MERNYETESNGAFGELILSGSTDQKKKKKITQDQQYTQ